MSFEILSNPEFLAEGTAVKDLLKPDRILIGSSQRPGGLAAAQALKDIYSSWVDPQKVLTVNIWSSELTKLAANAMLAQRISSINSLSALCERTGANVDEVARCIGLDSRLGPRFLKAGLGFGGSCFKKDILSLIYLARSLDLPEVGDYWQQVITMNEFQRSRFVNRVVSNLNGTLVGKKIAILGYAFKNNTRDTRESPAIDVVKLILADRPREIAIFDPCCNPTDIQQELQQVSAKTGLQLLKPEGPISVYYNAYDACVDASAALILTEWDQFRYPPILHSRSMFQSSTTGQMHASCCVSVKKTLAELDTITLRQHLLSAKTLGCDIDNPLDRYLAEPSCPEGCLECKRERTQEAQANESVDWVRISEHMKKPKWVFDGRGLVDVKGLENLGFRVEVIGKAGSRSPLEGRTASLIASIAYVTDEL